MSTPISPLPVPVPTRQDPSNFAARGDAFLSALPDFATQANAAAVQINANTTTAANAATTAVASRDAAKISQDAAAASQASATASASSASTSASNASASATQSANSATAAAASAATIDTAKLVGKDSSTGAANVPAGSTAQRPATVAVGQFRFNSTLGKFEGYSGASWGSVGGGATGGGADEIFIENGQTVNASYTVPSGRNAMSTGPITVNSGVTVTISAGSRYVVL